MQPGNDGFRQPPVQPVQSDAFPRPAAQRVVAMAQTRPVFIPAPRPAPPPVAPPASPSQPPTAFVDLPVAPPPSNIDGVQPVAEPQPSAVLESTPIVEHYDADALETAQPEVTSEPTPVVSPGSDHLRLFRYNGLAIAITSAVVLLIVLIGGGTLFVNSRHVNQGQPRASDYAFGSKLALGQVKSQLSAVSADQLAINGQLKANDTVVITPTSQPANPVTGQIYYDKGTNQPYYYDGKQFISLAPQGGVTSLGGSSGTIGLGSGLVVSGGQLSLSSNVLQQLAAAAASGSPQLVAGPGIGINGGTISNLGLVSLASGSSNLSVSNDGSGHYTIVDTSGGSAVSSITGTANQVNVSSSTGNVTLSLPQDIAVTSAPTFGGLTVDGGTLIKTTSAVALQIQDGTGSTNLFVADTADGRVGIGTAGPGYRLDVQGGDINTSGIYRVNGAQISSANLSNDSNLAKLDATNVFSAANTFSSTVSIQGPNSLTLGSGSNVGSIIFRDGSSSNTAKLQVAGVLSGNETFNLPVGTGTQTLCTVELGNCAGPSSVITGTGTANHLAKFTGSQVVADSSITDDGTVVTVSTGQIIQGAAGLTIGAGGVNGQLSFKNSSNSNTLTLQSGVMAGNLTLTLPTADGADGSCLKTNGSGVLSFVSCTGGTGGGVTSINTLTGVVSVVGTTNQVNVNTAGSTITLSLPQSINTTSSPSFRTITLNGTATGDNLITANAVSGATGNLLNLKVNGTSKLTVDASGNVSSAGQYQINGVQISSANLSNDSNLAKLNGTGPQTFTGNNKFTGTFLSRNASDSVTAFQIQNATGTSNLFNADTTHTRIGIGTATPAYTLDVNGDVNTSGVYRINGVTICASTGCTPSGGSNNYIQNGTSPQTADFNITGGGTIGTDLNFAAGTDHTISVEDSPANVDGGNVFVIGGNGINGTAAGGGAYLWGGNGNVQGGAVGVAAGDGLNASALGGELGLSAGNGGSSGTGGDAYLSGGSGGVTGGDVTIQGGANTAGAGTGGNVNIYSGNAGGNNNSNVSGNILINTPAPFNGASGDITISTSDDYEQSGTINLSTGGSNGNGGSINLATGDSYGTTNNITLTAGNNASSNAFQGGSISLQAGQGGDFHGTGGAISLLTGDGGGSTNGNSGDLTLGTGTPSSGGNYGSILLQQGGTTVASIANGGAATFQNSSDSATAFQIQDASGQSLLTADTTDEELAIGPAAVPANGVLTVGTNTTTASGGIYLGTDTDLYRSAAGTLQTDGNLAFVNGQIANSGSNLQIAANASAPGATGGYLDLGEGSANYPGGNAVLGGGNTSNVYGRSGASITVQGANYNAGSSIILALGEQAGGGGSQSFEVTDFDGNVLQQIGDTGATTFKNSADSPTAFQIQNAAGTADLFTADTSTLTVTVAGTSSTFGTLQLDNAHFYSHQSNKPTIGTPANCGTSPTAAVSGTNGSNPSTDSAGSFQITAGTGSPTTCDTTIAFNQNYASAPKSVVVVAETKDGGTGTAAARQIYTSNTTTSSFTVKFNSSPAAGEVDWFYYWVIE